MLPSLPVRCSFCEHLSSSLRYLPDNKGHKSKCSSSVTSQKEEFVLPSFCCLPITCLIWVFNSFLTGFLSTFVQPATGLFRKKPWHFGSADKKSLWPHPWMTERSQTLFLTSRVLSMVTMQQHICPPEHIKWSTVSGAQSKQLNAHSQTVNTIRYLSQLPPQAVGDACECHFYFLCWKYLPSALLLGPQITAPAGK